MFLLKITLPFHQSSQKNKNYYNCRQFVVMKHNNKLLSIHSAGVVSTIDCLIHKIYFLILPSQIFSSLSVTHYLSPSDSDATHRRYHDKSFLPGTSLLPSLPNRSKSRPSIFENTTLSLHSKKYLPDWKLSHFQSNPTSWYHFLLHKVCDSMKYRN